MPSLGYVARYSIRWLAALLVAWLALACSEPMDLRVVRSLLFTARAWYSTFPTIPWIHLITAASKLGEVSSSSGFWMLAPYIISRFWWGEHCGLRGAGWPYLRRSCQM